MRGCVAFCRLVACVLGFVSVSVAVASTPAPESVTSSGGNAAGQATPVPTTETRAAFQSAFRISRDLHNEMEGEHDHGKSFLRRLLENPVETLRDFKDDLKEKLNLKQLAIKGYRRYHMAAEEKTELQFHVRNLLSVWGTSHSLEVMSGPVTLAVGLARGWSWATIAKVSGPAFIAALPFSDPGCWVFVGSYAVSAGSHMAVQALCRVIDTKPPGPGLTVARGALQVAALPFRLHIQTVNLVRKAIALALEQGLIHVDRIALLEQALRDAENELQQSGSAENAVQMRVEIQRDRNLVEFQTLASEGAGREYSAATPGAGESQSLPAVSESSSRYWGTLIRLRSPEGAVLAELQVAKDLAHPELAPFLHEIRFADELVRHPNRRARLLEFLGLIHWNVRKAVSEVLDDPLAHEKEFQIRRIARDEVAGNWSVGFAERAIPVATRALLPFDRPQFAHRRLLAKCRQWLIQDRGNP